jgi:hypothetical protein
MSSSLGFDNSTIQLEYSQPGYAHLETKGNVPSPDKKCIATSSSVNSGSSADASIESLHDNILPKETVLSPNRIEVQLLANMEMGNGKGPSASNPSTSGKQLLDILI